MQKLVRTTFDFSNQKGLDKLATHRDLKDDEIWANDIYTVLVNRRHKTGWQNEDGSPITVTWLSIRRNDRAAKPDWRDFQWMKNQLVGDENEGFEIYPAESRLVDAANQFHLWIFENTDWRLPVGFTVRNVCEKSVMGSTQRKFPECRKPSDLEENYQKSLRGIDKINAELNENNLCHE